MEVIGVRYQNSHKIYFFSPKRIKFKPGDYVVVRSKQGKKVAVVSEANHHLPKSQLPNNVSAIIGRATKKDLQVMRQLQKEEKKVISKTRALVSRHQLAMKIVSAEYTLDKSKLLITFVADERIDFRALVRDLARIFQTRIELRQIGVRDEARKLGGISTCGREFCCSTFLGNFMPVSIKMAKEQGVSLNPMKISGLCGRLLCCLKYEDDFYKEARRRLPDYGTQVRTPLGDGVVQNINYLNEILRIKILDRDTVVDYKFEEIQVLRKKKNG